MREDECPLKYRGNSNTVINSEALPENSGGTRQLCVASVFVFRFFFFSP